MIRTVADLLKTLAEAEAVRISRAGIVHAPTIGAMYEGLSASLLEHSLPGDLNLQVVSGFATDEHGGISGQLDCMVVRGEGEAVPHTALHKWPVKGIIATLEVKKNLYGEELADSYLQMRDVLRVFSNWVQNTPSEETFDLKASFRAYAEVTGQVAPNADQWREHRIHHLDRHLILHTMIADQMAPVRVVLGYEGYKSEVGLRKGFRDYLANHIGEIGFGPPSLPNLIIAGEHALVKLSGHPYRSPLDKDGYLPLMASARVNPLLLLLETIWTRLSYLRPMAPFFGEDLEIENLALLLSAKPIENPEKPGTWGWMFKGTPATAKQLADYGASEAWQPTELTLKQFLLVQELTQHGEVNVTESDFVKYYGEGTGSVDAFLAGLMATHLVARRENTLELTTTKCLCVIMPDGRYLAADDNTGRFSRWMMKTMAARSEG